MLRKQYASWFLNNLYRFEKVIFFKPSPIFSFYINTKRFFSFEHKKITVFNKCVQLDEFYKHEQRKKEESKYQNLTKDNILSILNDKSLIKSEDWVYNLDNGRLKHEALLFDDNIIIRNLEGSMIESDVAIIEETSAEIQALVKPQGSSYISLIDLEKLSSISLKARRLSAVLMDRLHNQNKAIIFFNTNSNVRLAIKLTSAIKATIRERTFIVKDLEAAIILALSLKGVSIEKVKEEASKNYNLIKRVDRYFNKKKYKRIAELEKEIQKLKKQRENNVRHIFSMLSRISWDENFEPIHLDGIERDENYIELYKAIELLHKDIKELSKHYYADS